MTDIAQLGIRVDSSDLVNAKASMEALVPVAGRVESATEKVEQAFNGAAAGADRSARGFANAGNAAKAASSPVFRMAEGYDLLTGKVDRNFLAINNNMTRLTNVSNGVSTALKFNARDSLNFSRQMADIGVTAAMGMNPLMIALQQGPQLFDILQERAQASGVTIGAAFRAAGVAIWAALAPLLPLIAGIALAVGVVAGAFAIATREINDGNQSVIDGMGLTEKQLERVKKSGVDTAVTVGDTFFAFFSVVGDRLYDAFEGPLSWLSQAWSSTLDFITEYGSKAIEFVIGAFVGAVYAIRAAWQGLPAAMGDIIMSGANAVIAGVEWMINKSIDGLNFLLSFANNAAAQLGLPGLGEIGQVGLGRVSNPYAGQARALGGAIADGVRQGFGDAKGAVGRFFSDVGAKAKENARGRVRAVAGDPGAASGGGADGRKGGKSDGEKFSDIVEGANRDIAAQKAREQAAALTLTAEAATKLEYKTKLLNEAQQKGITATAAINTEIERLATAYAAAKTAADNAVALRDIMQGADKNIASIKQQAEMVGLYGRQLAYATEMARLLGEAQAKMTPAAIAAARPQFEAKANEYADGSADLERSKFSEEMRRTAAERLTVLKQEQAAIGLSADETTRLRIENELLAQARQKNIDLTPADIAAMQNIAREQAGVENAMRKTREAIAFTKDVTKGFFNDLRSNLQQGQNLWNAFGNAVLNVLNKIVEKLMDNLINNLIDGLFSQGGSGGISGVIKGLFNANGNVFGPSGLQAFAKGGSFTNGIVDRPTPFAFGGGQLGIMGEAGNEAIMPLQRGPDGSLGVQMYGGSGGGGTVVNAPVTVNNDNRVTGAVSSRDIVEMQKQSAEQTKRDLSREIPAIFQRYQRDGAIV